jgi:predicted RNA-binding protein YlqC (UPF0109 family)
VVLDLEHLRAPRAEGNKMKELVEYIAKSLVDHPDAVRVTEVEGERTSVVELSVTKEDLGKVIGKQGKTARAIRTILSAASTKENKRTILEIIE